MRDVRAASAAPAARWFCALDSSLVRAEWADEREGALRGEPVLVDQPAEKVSTANAIKVDYLGK